MTKEKKRFSKVLSVLLSAMLPFQLVPMQFGLTAAAEGEAAQSYVDAKGEDCSVSGYTSVTADVTNWADGWYVVNSDVTISSRIQVSGDVKLVLVGESGKEGTDSYKKKNTLTAEKGIHVRSDASLTIYSDFVDTKDYYRMGELIVYSEDDAAIGGNEDKIGGSITINGGYITTNQYTDFNGGAGIGGGSCSGNITDGGYAKSIVINDGYIAVGDSSMAGTANGAAIDYGSNAKDPNHAASIQINGGVVNAKSSTAAGIGSGAGCTESPKIEINGGRIHAWGGKNAAAIGGSNGYSKYSYITLEKKMYIKNPTNGSLYSVDGTDYHIISFGGSTPATEVEMEPEYKLTLAEGTSSEVADYLYYMTMKGANSNETISTYLYGDSNAHLLEGDVIRLFVSYGSLGHESPYYSGGTYTVETAGGEDVPLRQTIINSSQEYDRFTMPAADVVVTVDDLVGVNYTVNIDETTHGKVTSNADDIHHWIPYGGQVQLTVTPDKGYILKSLTVTTDKDGNEVAYGEDYTFTMPASGITVNAQFSYHPVGLTYIDKNYSTQQVPDGYTTVESDTTSWTDGWYVADDAVISDRVEVSGDVKLVLLDGKTLTAKQGIHVPADSTLTIYSQSIDLSSDLATQNGMGQLSAYTYNHGAGIGGNSGEVGGKIIINGGNVSASYIGDSSAYGGAAIGGGYKSYAQSVTINSGVVNTQAYNGAGIGYGYDFGYENGENARMGTIAITGGIVDSKSNFGAGIGSGSFSSVNVRLSPEISITGGTIHARSGTDDITSSCVAIGGYGAYYHENAIHLGDNMFITEPNGDLMNITNGNYIFIYSNNDNSCDSESNKEKNVTIKEGYKITFDAFAQDVIEAYGDLNKNGYALPGGRVGLSLKDFDTYTSAMITVTNDSTNEQVASFSVPSNSASFTMPEANVTISASDVVYKDYTITCQDSENGTISAPATAHAGDTVEVTVTPETNYLLKQMYYSYGSGESGTAANEIKQDENGAYTFTMPASNVTITATFTGYVPYFDPTTNKTLECTEYTIVDGNTPTWGTGWYYLSENAAFINRIKIDDNAQVNLILGDGKELEALQGIYVPDSASFTVWAQSADESTMGQLTATIAEPTDESARATWEKQSHYWAAIGGGYDQVWPSGDISNTDYSDPGKIIIMGGKITADSTGANILYANDETHNYGMTTGGAAIGGGNGALHKRGTISLKQKSDIIINGGIISAHSGYGAAIGGGAAANSSMPFGTDTNNKITINGGTVTATSENAAAIGTGVYSQSITPVITINGGEINAISMGENTAAIGIDKNTMSHPEFHFNGGTIHAKSEKGAAVGSVSENYYALFTLAERMVTKYVPNPSIPVTLPESNAKSFMVNVDGKEKYAEDLKIYQAYTVTVDDAITNIVTADKATAAAGETITLTVTPAEGYTVKSIKQNGTEVEAVNGVYTFTMPAADVVVTAEFEKAEEEPFFKGQALVLSGEIGVIFYMDLDCLTEDEKASGYVEFTINDKTNTHVKATFNQTRKLTQAGKTYYGFVCHVNSVQMADTIHAVYHYRNDKTVEMDYSVKTYLNNRVNGRNPATNEHELALYKAIADYGFYAQQYLSDLRGWKIGTDYAAMVRLADNDYDYDADKAATEKYARIRELGTSDLDTIGISLTLDTDTAINVVCGVKSGYTGAISATVNGKSTQIEKQKDGTYKVVIPGISAHLLGTMYNVAITTENGTATYKVSALSYAYNKLNNESSTTYEKNLASSLYHYYRTAIAYRDSK